MTGARFVAALAVFLYHASLAFPSEGVFGRALALVGRNGAVGVDFFFALSGFVLAWSWRTGERPAAFYRRRFARLAPAYWVALVYGLAWTVALYGDPLSSALHAIPAVFGIQAWFPDPAIHYAANSPEWSVSAEMFFYAVLPIVMALVATRAGRRGVSVAAAVLGGAAPFVIGRTVTGELGSWLINTFPVVRLGEFLCGVVLALALRSGRRSPVGPRTAGALLVAIYVAVPLAPAWFPHQAVTLAALLLVIAALAGADSRGARTVLASRIPVRLGDWSYCFYLVHVMTTQIVLFLCSRLLPAPAVGPVWLVASLTACIAAAATLHLVVERPFERRLRGGGLRRAGRASMPSASSGAPVPS